MSASVGRHPGAIEELAIGFLLGVEGETVTDLIQLWKETVVLPIIGRKMPDLRALFGPVLDAPLKRATDVSYQPIPLTINGPSQVATASGNLFQTAIKIPSFGLSGFKSGIERPGAKWN